MRNETRAQLDQLMVTYEKVKDMSQRDFGPVDQGQQHFTAVRRDVIRPTMEVFSEVLRSHGHAVRIYGHEMAVDQGGHSRNAELLMHVVPRNGDPASGASPDGFVVKFSFDAAENKVQAGITDGSGGTGGYARPYDLHPVDGVTSEMVEQELLEMIRFGFEAAERDLSAPRQTRVSA